jgi:hypothetical protein
MLSKPKTVVIFGLFSFLFSAAIFSPLPARALTTSDDIDTNRPSFTDSPLVVPRGSLQLENGALYQHFQHGTNYIDMSETEVRFGLTKRTEFQMFAPNWALLHSQGGGSAAPTTPRGTSNPVETSEGHTQSGVSGLGEVGIKRQFGPFFNDLNVAFIGGVNVPTGRRFISGNGVQPVLRMPWNKRPGKNWTLCGMQSMLVINGGRDVQWQNFWMLCRAIGTRTTVFSEYAGFYTQRFRPVNIAHFGVVRKLNRSNQVDVHFGFGLNKTAPAALVGVGYSFRFDRLAW